MSCWSGPVRNDFGQALCYPSYRKTLFANSQGSGILQAHRLILAGSAANIAAAFNNRSCIVFC